MLGTSVLRTWDYRRSLPDLRLIVITPSSLGWRALARLEQVGWSICYIPRLDYLVVTNKKYQVRPESSR